MGPKLLCQRIDKYNNKKLARLRYIAVCYHLLNDQQHRAKVLKELTVKANESESDNHIKSTPSEQKDLHKQHLNHYYNNEHYYNMNNNMQWRIGLHFNYKLYPQKMMQHVLESLKLIQMVWFFNSPYCIITRRKMQNRNKVKQNELKIQIQLYAGGKYDAGSFILDIQRIGGASFHFLDLCAKLMGAIKYLSATETV
eukprot:UN13611